MPNRILIIAIMLGIANSCASPEAARNRFPKQSKISFTDPDARKFAASFYEWYVPMIDQSDRIKIIASSEIHKALSPDLLQALKEDYEAQAKDTTGMIVGLDFDPFLASQDPCDRYEARKTVRKGNSFWVEIHGFGGCEPHDKPDVFAEVAHQNDAWIFVNFHYSASDSQDLLTVLAALRRDRLQK